MTAANAAYARRSSRLTAWKRTSRPRARASTCRSTRSWRSPALEHAAAQHERVGETLGKLEVEKDDLRREQERVDHERTAAIEALSRAQEALESIRLQHAARSRNWPARAASTRGAPARCARASRNWPLSKRGWPRCRSWRQPRRFRRRRPHGARAGQRSRRPAGRGGRLR